MVDFEYYVLIIVMSANLKLSMHFAREVETENFHTKMEEPK